MHYCEYLRLFKVPYHLKLVGAINRTWIRWLKQFGTSLELSWHLTTMINSVNVLPTLSLSLSLQLGQMQMLMMSH